MTMEAWRVEFTERFVRNREWYAKKRSRELNAVLHNLGRYMDQLLVCKNSKEIHAGYIHPEGKDVIALDEKGGGKGLQATRLYIYAEDSTKTVHLITLGNKKEQPDDIKVAHEFVKARKAKENEEQEKS